MMHFKVQQHELFKLKDRLYGMKVLVAGLLILNILSASVIIFLVLTQRVEVTPFSGGLSYKNSMFSPDPSYLKLMSENFIFLRLNTTPESVETLHHELLSRVSEKSYPAFIRLLEKEARLIREEKISSHFDIQSIEVNPSRLSCRIEGLLYRNVGLRALAVEKMRYQLRFSYHLGHLKLEQFIKEE